MKNSLKKLGLILALCFYALQGQAQSEGYQLSPDAKISLITCSSGSDLYAIFGHSAVRVHDPQAGLDIVFNYGTFDFDEPNFYLKFIRGKLNYKLSAAYFQDFVAAYTRDNRSVFEQELNLTPEQQQQYWAFITNNYLPENRFYLYDFFFDNCATRIRDGMEIAFPNQLKFNIDHLDRNMSFRNLIDLYLPPQPWSDFGIDLALGAPIDRKATPYEYMFLPDYLSEGLANATLQRDGQAVPLTGEKRVVFLQTPPDQEPASLSSPTVMWWVFFAIVLAVTVLDYTKRRRSRTFDVVLFLAAGLLGLLLFLLWTATDHQAAANNYNMLWALPTHIIAAAYLGRRNLPDWMQKYLWGTFALAVITLALWWLWPQQLHTAVFPIVLALALRAGYSAWLSKPATEPALTHTSR